MTPPPPGYPSAQPGPTFDEAPSTPPSGTSMDNNNKDGPFAPSMPPPPGRSAAPPPVGIVQQGKKGLLTVATGIMLFVFAMTAATAIGTSNRMKDVDSDDDGTIPDLERSLRKSRLWHYQFPAAILVHFWLFALSDLPSALVAIFVLANIAIFRRAMFYFIALIILVICFPVFLLAPIIITATTLTAKMSRDTTIKDFLAVDCCDPNKSGMDLCSSDDPWIKYAVGVCKTPQSWQITAIVLMWVFGLVSALLRAGYLFLLFLAWKKQRNNDGNSVR